MASRLIPKTIFETPEKQDSLVSGLLAADAVTPGLIILISGPSAFQYIPGSTSVTEAWRSSLYHVTVVSTWNWNATLSEKRDHYKIASDAIDHLRKITPDAAYQVRIHQVIYLGDCLHLCKNEADVYEPNHQGSHFLIFLNKGIDSLFSVSFWGDNYEALLKIKQK